MFENKNTSKTPLSEIGEFKLIEQLTKCFKLNQPSSKLGIGDDAAVLDFKGNQAVISTDLLIEGIHFDLSYMPLKHLGYKAVVVNLSDIYAMNAQASQITVSIAVSNRFPIEALEELYEGIAIACQHYKVDLVGGDMSSSTKGLLISVTAVGQVSVDKQVNRSGAKPNNLLVVSGDLGAAYLGWQILERERQVFKVNTNNQPNLDHYAYLIERQLKPKARQDIPLLLEKLEVQPTAMIDISDGLSSEVLHLCKASQVGCHLYEDKIPLDQQVIDTCEELRLDSTTIAINGGEDYELLFTISTEDYPKIKANPNLTVIGHMTSSTSERNLITRSGEHIPLTARGWDTMDN